MTDVPTSGSQQARHTLLAKIRAAESGFLQLAHLQLEQTRFQEEYQTRLQTLDRLYDQYEGTFHDDPVSRCPITGTEVTLKLDLGGLDGPCWDSTRPIRPVQVFPDTVFAYTGAVNLGGMVPYTGFEVRPGPSVPFIVPRFMHIDRMKATISSLRVGDFEAYVIFYFNTHQPQDVARINDWGTDHYVSTNPEGEVYSMDIDDLKVDFDFDIAAYIERGQVFWIAPNDETLQLRSTIFDCPYLDLPGDRHPVRLTHGTAWNSLFDLRQSKERGRDGQVA